MPFLLAEILNFQGSTHLNGVGSLSKKILKGLMSLCLGVCLVCSPILANAQDASQKTLLEGESNILLESMDMPILDINDAYPEVGQVEDVEEEYTPNSMDRVYDGENLKVDMTAAYSESEEQENTDPNYAYLVEHGNVIQGELTQTSEMRWYGFILEQRSKASIMLQTVSTVDADIYLFELDQDTYELNLVGGSATSGLGISEYCTEVLDEGIYYFAVSAYEGSGQYAFAFYATQDTNYEANDSKATAAEIGVNYTIKGVIDNPFDMDYYTFTISAPMITELTVNAGAYSFGIIKADSSTSIYKISQEEDMYQFDAGTYYLVVYSTDGTYDASTSYSIKLNKVANIADDANSFYYMINAKAGIVFQSDGYGSNMYVNGNTIDLSYSYNVDASNSAGTQRYNITMTNPSDLRAKIYQSQFMFEDAEEAIYYGMTMPDTVNYIKGSKGVGPTGNVLELSLYSSSSFYNIHCVCSGSYAANYYYKDLNFVTVFINPNTGKLVDIEHINYFYEYATGSNSMTFTRPYSTATKYYYPYYNGEEPTTW